jgi:hypothetical protein
MSLLRCISIESFIRGISLFHFRLFVFVPDQLISPPKQVPCRFSFKLSLLGLGPWSEGFGTILKGSIFLRCIQILSPCHFYFYFLFSFFKSCKHMFMNDYDKNLNYNNLKFNLLKI